MTNSLLAYATKALYIAAAILLMALALILVATAAWNVVESLAFGGEPLTTQVLHAVGLVIISIAVAEIAKFLIEEEVQRNRELRSSSEARQSLTKFITIIIIAVSLEALVMVFEAGEQGLQLVIFPAALLVAAVLALVGLALFQWFSRLSEQSRPRLQSLHGGEPERR